MLHPRPCRAAGSPRSAWSCRTYGYARDSALLVRQALWARWALRVQWDRLALPVRPALLVRQALWARWVLRAQWARLVRPVRPALLV